MSVAPEDRQPQAPSENQNAPEHKPQQPEQAASPPESPAETTSQPQSAAEPPKGPKQPMPGAEPAPQVTDQMKSEMDQAMQAATAPTAPAPQEAKEKPRAIRGPRVVEAGREHRHGAVVSIGPEDIFIEFGPKELGVAPRKQWKDEEIPAVGADIEVVIDRFEANEQLYMCSRPGAVQKADWELLEPGQVVEARVTGHNKGGLQLEIAKHRAFMPASLVDVHRIEDLSVFVGEKVRCVVKRVERGGAGNIVLSRRDVLASERKEQAEKLKDTLEEGQTVEGTVRKVMDFGAFVDIGGVDGLLHISDLSHDRVKKVEDMVKEGDTVKVKVLKVDWGKKRISLGLKQLEPDPWDAAQESVTEGEVVSGRVTKLMEFGAFVEVSPGVEGLVHISELSWKRVPSPDAVVKPDQVVKVKVLGVDPDKKRISLSVKQTTEPPASMKKKDKGESARSAEEIKKISPADRRLREKAKAKGKDEGLKSGLGSAGGLGAGLDSLDLSKFGGS